MTEHEAIVSLAALGDVFGSLATVYFSVTFAYISVACLVGNALSKFQCFAVSLLYIVATIIFGGSTIGYAEAWLTVKAQHKSALDEVWMMQDMGRLPMTVIIVIAITSLSLYFMYDVRKKGDN